jgi:TPR repeat protein
MNIEEAEDLFVSGDYTKALKAIEPMAMQGVAKAQLLLGLMYSDGLGVKRNNAEAFKWLHKAGEQDQISAFYPLYDIYRKGKGVKKDNIEAVKWLRKAGEQGDYFVLMELVDIYRKGKGIKKDNAEVLKWLRKAAEYGHDFGFQELGLMYFEGNGVEQDYVDAAKWFRKAIEDGHGDSHYKLGLMYLEGLGVRQDDTEAAKLFCKGAELGDSECRKAFVDLYKKGVYLREDECELVKLFRKATGEGDAELQRYLGLREYGYRIYFNKLTILTIGGLLTMILLAWYDWVMIANHVMAPVQKVGWFYLIFTVLDGLYLGGWLSDVPYRVSTNASVTGIPFPTILWESATYNSDDWIPFQGLYTIVSPILNACYLSLVVVAILLTIPANYSKLFFYFLLAIASGKGCYDKHNERLTQK